MSTRTKRNRIESDTAVPIPEEYAKAYLEGGLHEDEIVRAVNKERTGETQLLYYGAYNLATDILGPIYGSSEIAPGLTEDKQR